MGKTFTKSIFLVLLSLFVISTAFSQSITIGTVDPGPYGQGSSISVPIYVDNTTGCIGVNNVYTLYLSDASGDFASQKNLGTVSAFYATFINSVIPLGTPSGTGYKVKVVSSSPVVTSSISNAFSISGSTGVKAGIASSSPISVSNPDVFGVCAANPASPAQVYEFIDQSTDGSNVTASFYNEKTKSIVETKNLPANFTADFTNYTITVKAQKGGIIGTRSYELINNLANNGFNITGGGKVCTGSATPLSYNVDITTNNGIQNNYPGLTYKITWGDGTSNEYTICEIIAANGKVDHIYTKSSCGNNPNQQKNSFQIDIKPTSPYCASVTQIVTTYATVLEPALNSFKHTLNACTNSAVTFTNTSYPGQSSNSQDSGCENTDARYSWYVNDVLIKTGMRKEELFVYTFTKNGKYKITLRLQNNTILCATNDVVSEICIQDPPKPNFTIPTEYCLPAGPLTPVNTSIVDENCNANTTYKWNIVDGPANGVTFNAALKTPQFTFSKIGVYKIRLDITTLSCGTVEGLVKTIVVNSTPTASLASGNNICGKDVTLSFDPAATITKTTFDGTAQTLPTTYTWTITSATGGTYIFAPGSNANSQYPKITFNSFDKYTISVTHTNNCSTVTKTQELTFVTAPVVSAGLPQTDICEGTNVNLSGTPGIGGLISSVRWTNPAGTSTGFSNANSPNTVYTPTAADIANGQVLLTYTATTTLTAPCNQIYNTVLITFIKKATVTSTNTTTVCSKDNLNYTITSANPATTFTWTASLASGTATGFAPTGTGNIINEQLINNTTTNAVIKYTITPTLSGCTGTPFTLNVTVKPLPTLTATVVNADICSNQPANITLSSNLTGTTYIWESTTSIAGISGNTQQNAATATNSIQDILVNTSGVAGTVTYKITPYNGTCPGQPKTVTVTVQPLPKQSLPGPDEIICNQPTYQLKGNNPSPGTGIWTVTSGQIGLSFSDANSPTAVVSGLLPGQVYKFTWTIKTAANCPPSVNTVTITNNAEAVGGITAGTNIVCAGINNGQIILTGHLGTIIRWEQSVNNGANWATVNNITAALNYNNLTQTTQYRAVVQNGICSIKYSTVTTITVNQPAIIANAGADQSLCNQSSVTLDGNNPLTFIGTWTQVGGPTAGIVITDPTNPKTTITGLTGGNTYTFRWTIAGVTPCGSNSDDVVITNSVEAVGGTTAGTTVVCAGINNGQITLTGHLGTIIRWEQSVNNGANWATVNNITAALNYNNLTQTTQYRAVVQNGICSIKYSTVTTITVNQPAIIANAGADQSLCNQSSVTLDGNNPLSFIGTWTQVGGPTAGIVITNATNPKTTATGLTGGNTYTFRWTIAGVTPCGSNSDDVVITNSVEAVGGTTAGTTVVCAGINNGQITLTGHLGTIIRWEQSVNNGANWATVNNITAALNYNNLTQTTQYRAVVQNGICSIKYSTVTTITVNQPAIIANAGADQSLCNQNSVTLDGNNPLTFIGTWTQVGGPTAGIVITNATNPKTTVTGLTGGNTYTFRWTIAGVTPCGSNSDDVVITNKPNITANFTPSQTKVCGSGTSITFTNTSSPQIPGVVYEWDFGDGTTSNLTSPTHTFAAKTDVDVVYNVTLKIVGNCNTAPAIPQSITVSPEKPDARIAPNPTQACGAFTLTVKNESPGTNKQYEFYLVDENNVQKDYIIKLDKSNAVFSVNPTSAGAWHVYMVATDFCGNTNRSNIPQINVAPSDISSYMNVKNNQTTVCLGASVTFQNTSSGGDSFIYNIYDDGQNIIKQLQAGKSDFTYTFPNTGQYYVSITAKTTGCGLAAPSPLYPIQVIPLPQPNFTYTIDADNNVTFVNTTPNTGSIPASSLNYKWTFGDGTADDNYTPTKHGYGSANASYTVTLTASTPGTNCQNIITKKIDIKFNGGLYLPNAFMPLGTSTELKTFKAKGQKLKQWKLQIFNNWGELLWQTTALDGNGEPVEGWDGTYKGVLVQQGTYIWQASATFINGSEWKGMSYNGSLPKRSGYIHLIK